MTSPQIDINVFAALRNNGERQLTDLDDEILSTLNKLTTLYVQRSKLAAILDLQAQLDNRMTEKKRLEQETEAPAQEALPHGSETPLRPLGVDPTFRSSLAGVSSVASTSPR